MPKALAVMPLFLAGGAAQAQTLTAGVALDRMGNSLGSYVQGIVEGLAQARYEVDGHTNGMRCIFEWYYGDDDAIADTVISAFERYRDHSPGAVMSGLIARECPP